MVKQISTYTLGLAALLFFLTSCTKDGSISQSTDITGDWVVTGIRSDIPYDWNGDGYTERDIFNSYSYCERDIAFNFDYGGYGQIRQGCNASWKALYWDLSGNRLQLDLPGDDINLQLTQLSYNTIRGDDYVYIDGRNFVISYTLSRR
jgi:hypothetical protein